VKMNGGAFIFWGLLRSIAFGIALSSAFFAGVLDRATCFGIGAGVVFGGVLGAVGGLKIGARRGALTLGMLVGACLFFGVPIWRNFFVFAGGPAAHGLAWLLGAAGFVAAMEFARKTGLAGRAGCTALFLFGSVRMLEPSTRGHLERPYWLVERALERNFSPEVLWLLVACVVLPLAFALLRDDSGGNTKTSAPRLIASAVLWGALLCGLFVLPRPSKSPVPEPPAPRAPDAPPPPPPPQKIAAVAFTGFCRPTDFTDNAYLFHLQPVDSIAPAEPLDQPLSDNRQTHLKTRMFLFSKANEVPALIGFRGGEKLQDYDRSRFEDAFELDVVFPRDSGGPYERLAVPAGRELSRLEQVLWQQIFEETEIRPEKAAEQIKTSLEKAGKLSERSAIPPEKWNLEAFLLENTTGGNENFVKAAVDLLQMAGMEARSVRGLRYSPGEKGGFKFKEWILLSEGHLSVWAEWRVPGGMWQPLVVHPETVLDDKPPPPPEEDLENLLARETSKPKPASKGAVDTNTLPPWGGPLALFFTAFCGLSILSFLIELWVVNERESVVFRWMLGLLAGFGYRCATGEGWAAFEQRVGLVRPGAALELHGLRRAVENQRWDLKKDRPPLSGLLACFARFLLKLLFIVPRPKHSNHAVSNP
jgi:hypothetical protein